jgi:hypothetical protein
MFRPEKTIFRCKHIQNNVQGLNLCIYLLRSHKSSGRSLKLTSRLYQEQRLKMLGTILSQIHAILKCSTFTRGKRKKMHGHNYIPCVPYCLPVKNLKCIVRAWIFMSYVTNLMQLKFVKIMERIYAPRRAIIEPRVSASPFVETETFWGKCCPELLVCFPTLQACSM